MLKALWTYKTSKEVVEQLHEVNVTEHKLMCQVATSSCARWSQVTLPVHKGMCQTVNWYARPHIVVPVDKLMCQAANCCFRPQVVVPSHRHHKVDVPSNRHHKVDVPSRSFMWQTRFSCHKSKVSRWIWCARDICFGAMQQIDVWGEMWLKQLQQNVIQTN